MAVACVLAGSRLRGRLARAGEGSLYRGALYGVAGLLGLYLAQVALFALGIPWSAASLAGGLAVLATAAHLASRRMPAPPPGPLAFGWGDTVALACLAAVAVCAVLLWMLYSDFVFHWGIKGQRFYFTRGFDFEFLARPWNTLRHPEYPNFYPALLAATAAVAGRFAEPAMMLWTALFFLALLAAGREALRCSAASRPAAQATLALLALGLAMFGIGYTMGGSPDWLLALVPLAAWPLLLSAERSETGQRAPDLALGLLAALAAAAKLEGLPLAVFLAVVYLARRGRGWWRALPAVVIPTALVAGIWLAHDWRYDLPSAPGTEGRALSFRYAGTIARAAFESLQVPEWHGAGFLVLLLPALILCRPVRPAALVASLQLAFYAYVYLATKHPTAEAAEFFVRSNLPRLAFHVWPVAVVGCGIALDRWATQKASVSPSPQISPAGLL